MTRIDSCRRRRSTVALCSFVSLLAPLAVHAQERIYVGQLNPGRIHAFAYDGSSFDPQPDGGAPLATSTEVWELAATDAFWLAGGPLNGTSFRAVSPNGVVSPIVEGSTSGGAGGLFLIGDWAIAVGGLPGTVAVVDFDPASATFLKQLDAHADSGEANGAALSPDGTKLHVARNAASFPGFATRIDTYDLSTLPTLMLVQTEFVPVLFGSNRAVNGLRSFSSGGRDYLALFRRDLQFLELDASGLPQLVFSLRLNHPSPNAVNLRRFYDAVFDAATQRAVTLVGTQDDTPDATAFHELLVVDLSHLADATPDAPIVARAEIEPPFTRTDSGDPLARSLDGSKIYHLSNASAPGDPDSRLRAYHLGPLLAGAGDVAFAAIDAGEVELDPGTPSVTAPALLVRAQPVVAPTGLTLTDAVNVEDGSHLLPNDAPRQIQIAGSGLGSASRVFLGSRWLTGVSATSTSAQATMPALTPAGDLPLGVVGANGALARFDGMKVVAPPSFLPAAVAYVSNTGGNSITVMNASSETEVTAELVAGVQGPSGIEVSADGDYLFVGGFRDGQVAVHCLVAGADGLPCGWNDVAAALPLADFSVSGDMELSADGTRLFVNNLWPGVDVIDTTTAPPSMLARLYHSTYDDDPFTGVVRAIAVERASSPSGDWLYLANSQDPHLLAVDVTGVAADLDPSAFVGTSIPDLAGSVGRSDGIAVSADGSKLYFSHTFDTVVRSFDIDPLDGGHLTETGSIPLTAAIQQVRHLALSPDGRFLYVAGRNSGTTEIIELQASTDCPAPPCAVAQPVTGPVSNWATVSRDGSFVYVASIGSNSVAVIDERSGSSTRHQVLTVTATGSSPSEVALTPGVGTPTGGDVAVTPAPGAEIVFDDVTAAGSTTVTAANVSDVPLPADFAVPGTGVAVYYDVNTTATFEGLVTVCFAYDDAAMTPAQEDALRLLHEETCTAGLDAAGATGCDPAGYGADLLTDRTEFECTASGVAKGDCAAGELDTTKTRFITELPVDTAGNTICGRVGSFSQFVAVVPVLQVAIDVRPGISPNVVNLKSKGSVEVAVVSTPGFDAGDVDPATVRLGIATIRSVGRRGSSFVYTDIDLDGDVDLVTKFAIQELGLSTGATKLALTGRLSDGTPIRGTDDALVK